MREKLENTIFYVVAILSILISTLDWLGLLDTIDSLSSKIPSITLLTLGLVATYLITERRRKLDKLEHLLVYGTDHVIRSLHGVSVKRFMNSRDVYEYVARRMHTAKESIDDLTWGFAEEERTSASQAALEKYLQTLVKTCKKKKNLGYREVMSFPPVEHLSRAQAMLDRKLPNYSLRFYRSTQPMPLVAFMVIDSSEVIVSFYRAPILPASGEIRFATTHPDIVAFFQDYYETIWKSAEILQEGSKSYPEKVRNIEMFLKSLVPSEVQT
jgi:hypothetical protein